MSVSLLATSCLDFQPKASLGEEYVWTSSSNFQLFANQFYAWDRGFNSMMNDGSYSDPRADLITGYGSQNDYSQGVHTVPNEDSNYGTTYKRIYYCNLLLEAAESYSDIDEISSPVGEAYFYRAILHYELLRLYGDAIVLTEPLDITSDKLYSTQDNRSVVVDQIISDYQSAVEYLPETASEEGRLTKNSALANLARAALFEGTWQKFHNHCSGGATDSNGNFSYSSFGRYDESETIANTERSTYLLTVARDAAKEVMDSGAYSLFYNETLGTDSYRYLFTLEDAAQCNPANVGKSANTEFIHTDRHRDGDTMPQVTHSLLCNAWVVTRKMADMYLCTDGLPIDKSPLFGGRTLQTDEFENRDRRMETSIVVNSQKYWSNDGYFRVYWDERDLESMHTMGTLNYTGYWNKKFGSERESIDRYESMDFPILRYAEVLLTYAEATYELNNAITDAELNISLNLLRTRVGMPSLNTTFAAFYNLSLREEIRRERTVELYCEGLRLDDIRRWAKGSDEMPGDLEGVLYTGTYSASSAWSGDTSSLDEEGNIIFRGNRSWDDTKHYLYPLPSDELQLNPNLRQNAGWN